MKKALITGITGQDWAYLAEFLLEKGYISRKLFKSKKRVRLVTKNNIKSIGWRHDEIWLRTNEKRIKFN